MKLRRIPFAIVAVTMAFGSASASAQTTFTFTQLDPPGSVSTEADLINSQGQIIGFFFDAAAESMAGFFRTARSRKLIFPAPAAHARSISTIPA